MKKSGRANARELTPEEIALLRCPNDGGPMLYSVGAHLARCCTCRRAFTALPSDYEREDQ